MDEACHHCLFENSSHIYCKKTTFDVYSPTKDKLDTICESSRKRGDGIHLEIQARSVIYVHRNCASTYCSSQHITRTLSETVGKGIPNKRLRRDVDGNFNYKQQCVFCGEKCKNDKKHPGRTNKFSSCSVVTAIIRHTTVKNEHLKTKF